MVEMAHTTEKNHNFNYFRSTVLELLLHPELSTQKGNKFCKIGSSTKFYVKNSSDITKRRSARDKQEDKRIHAFKLKQNNRYFAGLYININVKEVFFSFCNCSLFPQ